MARNKYPEMTVERILADASKLFMTKGFEATSIKDIMDATGFSKGAIYHHFTSKEDIFDKVTDRMSQGLYHSLFAQLNNKELSGHDKVKEILKISLTSGEQEQTIGMTPNMLDNPKFIAIMLRSVFEINVPVILEPIIKQGIEDGSIVAQHPKQVAEALLILANLWINPLIYGGTQEEILNRLDVMDTMLKAVGLDLFDDEMRQKCLAFVVKMAK